MFGLAMLDVVAVVAQIVTCCVSGTEIVLLVITLGEAIMGREQLLRV